LAIVIIGAGVAGLTCASVLHSAGLAVRVLEAQPLVGGRVRTARDSTGAYLGDLGPSWVWPVYQPALATWLKQLGVHTEPQYETGMGCVDRSAQQAPQHIPIPGQHGQHRPVGGPQAIVDALLSTLPPDTVQTNCQVSWVKNNSDGCIVKTQAGEEFTADALVVAAPLRVVARDIEFQPALPSEFMALCHASPTWMAAQAKALITYDEPFWRHDGLSGRIASSVGPLVEAHDHTSSDAFGALVGFIGLDANTRRRLAEQQGEQALADAVLEQLVRCFGQRAAQPRSMHIEDWALDPCISSLADSQQASGHPAVLPDLVREPVWESRLYFACAETAMVSPGLLEGALLAGEGMAQHIAESAR